MKIFGHILNLKWWLLLALSLAGLLKFCLFTIPIIFGKIIDRYALNPGNKTETNLLKELSSG